MLTVGLGTATTHLAIAHGVSLVMAKNSGFTQRAMRLGAGYFRLVAQQGKSAYALKRYYPSTRDLNANCLDLMRIGLSM